MNQIFLMGILGIAAAEDLRRKKITVWYLAAAALTEVIRQVWVQQWQPGTFFLGLIPGLILGIISIVTKEKVGLGDAITCLLVGIFLGFSKTIEMLCAGLFAAALMSLVLLVVKKGKKDMQIPFVPFLLAGYIAVLVGEQL